MDTPALIRMEHIACSYYVRKNRLVMGKVEALSDVNLELHQGEILGIVGHNGAGKSTLLQMMAGILSPSGGTLWRAPDVSASLLSLRLGFAPELTGRENAVLGAMYLGRTHKQAVERVPSIIEFAELDKWADMPLRTYSTGMASRLGFAVAMEMMPDILLIDETLGVGDSYFQKKSRDALTEKIKGGQQTAVLVSHSREAMLSLCDRAIWLHQGRTKLEGKPGDILHAYEEWVASRRTGKQKGCGAVMKGPKV